MRADIKAAGDAPWLAALATPDDDNWIWTWYGKAGNYDNSQAWAAVRVPVLILFGADDALVPPQESVAETVRLLKGGDTANVVVRVFAHADHTLRVPPATPDGWPHNAPGFPQIIAKFAANPGSGATLTDQFGRGRNHGPAESRRLICYARRSWEAKQ